MEKKKLFQNKTPSQAAEEIISMMSSKTDPQGSYTGVPINPGEKPVQDADDL